jgi:hypothetical protein
MHIFEYRHRRMLRVLKVLKDLYEKVFQDVCHSLKRFKNSPNGGQYLLIVLS